MKGIGASILALVMLLAMLAGEPARAAMAVMFEAAERQSCMCGDDGGCCCAGDEQGCEDRDLPGEHGHDQCPCSPGSSRGVSVSPAVAAVVERRSTVRVDRTEGEPVDAGLGAPETKAALVGAGREPAGSSVGERLALWCVRQV